jgi:antitoxin component YwqK of YwqJK toxin-antitoxin module
MKKIISIIVMSLAIKSIQSQNVRCSDTVTVKFNKYEDFATKITTAVESGYYLNDTIYYCRNRKAKKNGITTLEAQRIGKLFTCNTKNYYKFFRFYTSGWDLIAEGYWDAEGFQGIYREFYKSGKLKEEGSRNGELKTGHWKFYDESGKLVKEELHDERGNLITK